MTWYYKEGNRELGPVSKKDLQELINTRRINGRTLVRSTAMTHWASLTDVVRGKSRQPRTPPAPISSPPPAASTAEPSPIDDEATLAVSICSQCGRSFTQDQVVVFDDQVICAACKPLFVQKLKEGVAVQGTLPFAGFWIRFGAWVIDTIIMNIVKWGIFFLLGFWTASALKAKPAEPAVIAGYIMLFMVQLLVGIGIPAIYSTFFLGRFGATVGKMACGLKVVTPEGGKITYWRGLGRYFAYLISAIILYIGCIMAAFDDEKRALHDRICSTRVVRA